MVGRLLSAIPVPSLLRRRAGECMALGFVLFGVLLAAALMTYTTSDPSWNQTGDVPVQNALGSVGANIADLLKQTVGWMSVMVVVAFFGWSWRLIMKDDNLQLRWRFVALLFALVSGSTLLALLAASSGAPWLATASGPIGIVMGNALVPLITVWGVVALMGLMFAASLPVAIGLRLHEWVAISIMLRRAGAYAAAGFMGVMAWIRGRADRSEDDEEEYDEDEEYEDEDALDEDEDADAEEDEEDDRDLLGPRLESKPKKRIEAKKAKKASDQGALDLRSRSGAYTMPSLNLMSKPSGKGPKQLSESALEQNARLLESVLDDFGVKGEITRVRPGPVVTLYELSPAPGIKSSRVIGLADDIARSMSAISARISVIPGQNALGIELPNAHRETVYMREMLEDDAYESTEAKLPLVLGKDISGEPIIADLARMPHVLVAGTTGSGKSVAINTMIMSLVYHMTPEQCKFIMIDPKMLELSVYDNIPHLLSPVVTEPGKAVVALKWAVKEMEQRYRLMSNLGVRNIDNYNKRLEEARKKGEELTRTVQTGFDPETGKPIMEKQAMDMNALPYIVVIVDEMADLMLVAGKDIESSIQRLAQMARAAGIHIIMATQRPSVDVITGVIKANFPTRISFQVTSKIDSRTILGEQGAEQLLGQGDMLYMAGGGRITRVHGPFISDKEVEQIVAYLRTQGEPQYDAAVTFDEEAESENGELFDEDETEADKALYRQAVEIVVRDQKASTSYVQRKLKIGYNRAARIIEKMEQEGIVGAPNHVGKREVLER
ncbi:MAG: cell division protein FtsK [Azospirillum brasilense]|nr:MAG: cell division protein FtsK [Azospirillum brasilense]